MTNNLTIRRFEPADTGPLSDIWFRASLIAHPFLGAELLTGQRALIETRYLPDAETWCADIDGQPAGFIGLVDSFIGGLFVAPEQQGKGIGRALLAHALALRGGRLSLEVYAANTGALGFYRANGFRELSRREVDDQGLPFANIHMAIGAEDLPATPG